MKFSEINDNSLYGRYLFAALSQLTFLYPDITPEDIMLKLDDLVTGIYPKPIEPDAPRTFGKELTVLLNRYSMENGSNTPDFILADYLLRCLDTFNIVSRQREKWYGKELKIS